jgi:Carbohydrate binding domain
MGTAPRRQPTPAAPTDAYRDLSAHLRYMLEREGLTPRQLATADDVPYSAAMLYRYLSGEELPPPLLIEVVARHCRTSPGALRTAYERACQAAAATHGRRSGTRPARHARGDQQIAQTGRVRGRHAKARPKRGAGVRLVMIGAGFSAAGTVVLATTMVPGFDSQPAAAAKHVDPTDAPAPATNANGVFQGAPQAPASPPAGKASSAPPGSAAGGGQPGGSEQMIENGTFTGTVGNWLARSDTLIRVDRNRLRINITPDADFDPTDAPAVKYRLPALRYARNYAFSFRAAADSKTTIRVTVQSEGEPRARALSEDVVLGQQMREVTLPFRSRFELSDADLAVHVVADSGKHSIWIDDVSMRHRPLLP